MHAAREGCITRGKEDKRDAWQEGKRTGGMHGSREGGQEGCRAGRKGGLAGCSSGGIQDRRDACQEGRRAGGTKDRMMQDSRDPGQEDFISVFFLTDYKHLFILFTFFLAFLL